MLSEPIMVLNSGLNPAIGGKLDSHSLQLSTWIFQKIKQLLGRRFPKVKMKRFVTNNSGNGREVNNFSWHGSSPSNSQGGSTQGH
jgi:hypothetical protein